MNNTKCNDDNDERDNDKGDVNSNKYHSDDNNNNIEHEDFWKVLPRELLLAMQLTITFCKRQ